MNMSNQGYDEQDFEYRFDGLRRREPDGSSGSTARTHQKRRVHYSRANRPAVSHNGIHRRRNKRSGW